MQQLVGQSNEENTPALRNTAAYFNDPKSLNDINGYLPDLQEDDGPVVEWDDLAT